MDNLTESQRRLNMSRVKSANTRFEQRIFRELRHKDVHFVTHHRQVPGTPDIALPAKKMAVFLHSDFWHGWQFSRWAVQLPSEFWRNKIEKNRLRDKKVKRRLRSLGWEVLVIWEHSIEANRKKAIEIILHFLRNQNAEAKMSGMKSKKRK